MLMKTNANFKQYIKHIYLYSYVIKLICKRKLLIQITGNHAHKGEKSYFEMFNDILFKVIYLK